MKASAGSTKSLKKTKSGGDIQTVSDYLRARDKQARRNTRDHLLFASIDSFTQTLIRTNYVKNFTWMGRPILQYPMDLIGLQEIIWAVKPKVIIETGTAFGGLSVFCASILNAIGEYGWVITIDKEVRQHNKEALSKHPLGSDIEIIEGNSISKKTLKAVKKMTINTTLVILDSNHTHKHVLEELQLYSPLVSMGSYIIVFDTAIEFYGHLDKNQDRPWRPGNNPWTAVQEFMKDNDEFINDSNIGARVLITGAPGGWLKRVKPCK